MKLLIIILLIYWLANFIFFMWEAPSKLTSIKHPFSVIVFYWLFSSYRKNLKK
jgi:hypothetical protein